MNVYLPHRTEEDIPLGRKHQRSYGDCDPLLDDNKQQK